MRGGTGRMRASAGWWRRPSRRWCGCIARSTASSRSRRGAGAARRSAPRRGARSAHSGARCASRPHETVIDAQGLLRSALIARFARGRRHGYDRDSVRERAASLVLRRASSRRSLAACDHAQPDADRRRCSAMRPMGRLDFGLDRAALTRRRGGARRGPAARDRAAREGMAGRALDRAWRRRSRARGYRSCCRGAREAERRRSVEIAAAVPNARSARAASRSTQVARMIARAAFVVGVDTGLLHLAAALGVPLVGDLRRHRAGTARPARRGQDRDRRRARRDALGRGCAAPPSSGLRLKRAGACAERALRRLPAPARPRCRACSGDGPCGRSACGTAGSRVASSVCTVAAIGLSGAQCHGLVGPKMPIVGVPSAAATCSSPESFETATSEAASARIALRRSVPVRSRASGPASAMISAASGFSSGPPSTQTAMPCCGQRAARAPRRMRPASASTGRPRRARARPTGRRRSGPSRSRQPATSAGGTRSSGRGHSVRLRRVGRQRQRGALVDHARPLFVRRSADR